MGSATPDPRRMQRRDSSPRTTTKRRPRLLRASATELSITTSNASRNSLATSHECGRATDLLNRVAFVSGSPPSSGIRPSSPLSPPTPTYDSIGPRRGGVMDNAGNGGDGDLSVSPTSHIDDYRNLHHHHPGRYFSFPSFDVYEEGQHDEEDKDASMKSP
ncbi:hypothetical protein VTK73DRAFT_9573 [Phialemonium thermophilum]|uniref:Uncharacterized protein n=1 Tax=Phialemonium thermophilum TaxID=223376 RepID=A0ABR3XKU1_9PEZI